MFKIFESVPNISEGRNKKKLTFLLREVAKVPEVKILNFSSDYDHNRSVLTMIGTEQGIIQANIKLVQKAKQLLDLSKHKGIHPRVGVIDVLPIIPLLNSSMADAVKTAKKIGEFIESKLKIPVYYYGNAATHEKYRNLANIRREKYNITRHRTAGAVCVGARNFLVAYNINLDTQDKEIAFKIARVIREKYTDIKTLGLFLKTKNCVQISMNLINPLRTGPKKAYAAVAREAKKLKVRIKEQELIGFLPKQVIIAAKKFAGERKINGQFKKS